MTFFFLLRGQRKRLYRITNAERDFRTLFQVNTQISHILLIRVKGSPIRPLLLSIFNFILHHPTVYPAKVLSHLLDLNRSVSSLLLS